MRLKTIGYWTATVLVAVPLLSVGAAQFERQKETVDAIMRLGYPTYFVAILGFWKVLRGIALLAPRFLRLKEWAYAGAFFDLTDAAASHVVWQRDLACGDDCCLSSARIDFVGVAATKPHAGNSLSARAFSS